MHHRQHTLERRAHVLHSAPTAGEQMLWSAISGRRLGVSFRRQVPLAGRFIVDFVAPSARLVIEVDGGVHALKRGADARKDRALQRLGYRVLRLSDELVRAARRGVDADPCGVGRAAVTGATQICPDQTCG